MKLIKSSILAGICISLGGAVNLAIGGIAGAILFAFGLISVIYFKFALYTGQAGFIRTKKDLLDLLITLIGNAIGCLLIGLLVKNDGGDIIYTRVYESTYTRCLLDAILCGIVMTFAVKSGRGGQLLLVVFGIPLFILSGFCHSIADCFYMFAIKDDMELFLNYLPFWGVIIIGNFIGCNIPTIIDKDLRK